MRTDRCIEYILSPDKKKRTQALEFLYQNAFPKVAVYIESNSGSSEEARDIFQDAIAVVYANLLNGKFRGDSAITSYIYAISRNLWLQQLRKRKIVTTTLETEQLREEYDEEVNVSLVGRVLERLDEGCRSLLISFYFHKHSMQEVAQQFGLSSTQAAKTKKLRCMKKLSQIIQEHGLEKDHFII